jgi:DNA-binding transcriptional ArsR family regulator
MDVEFVETNAIKAAQVLKALSNQRRLLVLCALCGGEKCVGELESIIGISQSALSQHLAKLREDNMVVTRREAQTIFYSVSNAAVHDLLNCLNRIFSEQQPTLQPALD